MTENKEILENVSKENNINVSFLEGMRYAYENIRARYTLNEADRSNPTLIRVREACTKEINRFNEKLKGQEHSPVEGLENTGEPNE